jgi:hypothetical protein
MKPGNRNPPPGAGKGKSTLGEIQRMEKEREARRRHMEERKQERAAEEQRNRDRGLGDADVDFQRMILAFRDKVRRLRGLHHLSFLQILDAFLNYLCLFVSHSHHS